VDVGAGVGVINSPYKQYDRDVYPVPVITYEGDNFWFRASAAATICGTITPDKLSVMAYYDPSTSSRVTATTTNCAARQT
jgi:outer membrane protein